MADQATHPELKVLPVSVNEWFRRMPGGGTARPIGGAVDVASGSETVEILTRGATLFTEQFDRPPGDGGQTAFVTAEGEIK